MNSEDGSFEKDVRDFIAWTRKTLQCIKEAMHDLDKHQAQQNGNIALVMQQEEVTSGCAIQARTMAEQNARDIVALRVGANADRAHSKESSGEMRGEIKWVRENLWKLALAGVSVLALIDEVAGLVQRFAGTP